MSGARLVVVNSDGHQPVYTGKADDAFPFAATWLSETDLVYTGSGHVLKVDLTAKSETAIPFTAGIKSIRPQFTRKVYNFDSTAPRVVKGIYAPALSPDGKQVAFVALNQLYVMKIGSAPVALTHDTYYKQGPAWPADGKTLAYVSDKDGIENVYLHDLSAATTDADKRVSPSQEAQIMPAWSPDGKLIACQDHTGATVLLTVATGAMKPLAPATFFPGRPAFSASGETVSIATIKPYTKRFREGTSAILTVNVKTGKTEFFEPAPFESITTRTEDGPIYSPNGKEMAFVMDDLLYTMPVDVSGKPSGSAVKLNDETTDAPTWSGDSSKILYLNNGKLRMISRATKAITPVEANLTYTPNMPTQKLLIHAGRFWKGSGPDEQTDVDILVTNNRITSVTPHSATPPAGVTRTIEAGDLTVMPGLTESHAHDDSDNSIYYGDRMGRLWLIYGITQVRAIADNAYRALQHQEAYRSGAAVGPRLFSTAEAVDGERVYYPMMIPTTSEAQLHREFARLKALDFDFVKLYVRLPFKWAEEGIQYAHTQMGVETASHYLLPAVSLGEDGMSHISATARTGYAYSRSFTGVSYSDVRTLLTDSKMWTISTILNPTMYVDNPTMPEDPKYKVAPPWELARLVAARDADLKADQTDAMMRVKDEEDTVAAVIKSGGYILAGTDSPLDLTATSLHLNLRAQVKFGMAPWQALETATILPAKAFGLSKDLGTLEPGKLADLILVEGDPLKDVKAAAAVQCVMENGVLRSVGSIMAPLFPAIRPATRSVRRARASCRTWPEGPAPAGALALALAIAPGKLGAFAAERLVCQLGMGERLGGSALTRQRASPSQMDDPDLVRHGIDLAVHDAEEPGCGVFGLLELSGRQVSPAQPDQRSVQAHVIWADNAIQLANRGLEQGDSLLLLPAGDHCQAEVSGSSLERVIAVFAAALLEAIVGAAEGLDARLGIAGLLIQERENLLRAGCVADGVRLALIDGDGLLGQLLLFSLNCGATVADEGQVQRRVGNGTHRPTPRDYALP